jgi:GGDEF domain-containing protein
MVSPILNNNSSEVANYLKTYDKKIKKVSEQFQNVFGYKEDELENIHINDFLKTTKNHTEKLEYASTYFFKSNIPTKWGVSKEAIIIKVSIDCDEELFIFKEDLKENDFMYLQNSYVDKITGVQCKHSFNKVINKDIDFFAVYIDIKNFLHISSFYGDDFAENLISDISKKLKLYFDLSSLYKIESDVFCIIKKKAEYYNFEEFEEEIDLRLKDIFECSTTNALPIKIGRAHV